MDISKEEYDRIEKKTEEVKKAIRLRKVDAPCCSRCKHMVPDFDELCICTNPAIDAEARGNLRIKPDTVCRLFEPKDSTDEKQPVKCGLIFNICPFRSGEGLCTCKDVCSMKRKIDSEGNYVPLSW